MVAICKAIKATKSEEKKRDKKRNGKGQQEQRKGEGGEEEGEGKTRHSHAHNSIGSNKSTFNFIYYRRNVRESVCECVCESTSVNHVVSVCKLSFEWTLMSTCLCTDAERYPSDTFTPKGNVDLMRSYVIA